MTGPALPSRAAPAPSGTAILSRLAAIRARLAVATPVEVSGVAAIEMGEWAVVGPDLTIAARCLRREDARLYACAPSDLAWLCTQLERCMGGAS